MEEMASNRKKKICFPKVVPQLYTQPPPNPLKLCYESGVLSLTLSPDFRRTGSVFLWKSVKVKFLFMSQRLTEKLFFFFSLLRTFFYLSNWSQTPVKNGEMKSENGARFPALFCLQSPVSFPPPLFSLLKPSFTPTMSKESFLFTSESVGEGHPG